MAAEPARAPRASKRWIWLGLAIVGVVAVTAYLWTQVRAAQPTGPGNQAPLFTASAIRDGSSVSLADLRGKPVLLNFWASWCGPCKDEAPLLNKAYKRYGDRVSFVGVDSHDARSDAATFLQQHSVRYPNVFDGGSQIYRDYALTGQPETFFIDAKGTVVAHVPGPLFSSLLHREISRLLR